MLFDRGERREGILCMVETKKWMKIADNGTSMDKTVLGKQAESKINWRT